MIHVHTDGGARGNPGPAAVGVVIEKIDDRGVKEKIFSLGKYIGDTTNNVAEYTAVIEALKFLQAKPSGVGEQVEFYLDSELVVRQLNGIYKVKDSKLRGLLLEVHGLLSGVGGRVTFSHVRREQNSDADALVNQALDSLNRDKKQETGDKGIID